jgi:CBS domain-containing protein
MDWFSAGLPREGAEAEVVRVGDLAHSDVPRAGLDDRADAMKPRLGHWDVCVVVAQGMVVLGMAAEDALTNAGDQPVSRIMDEAPTTYRPHSTAAEVAAAMGEADQRHAVVTNAAGQLLGIARRDEVESAANS